MNFLEFQESLARICTEIGPKFFKFNNNEINDPNFK